MLPILETPKFTSRKLLFFLFSKAFHTYLCVMTTGKVSSRDFSASLQEPLQHILTLCSSIVCIWRLHIWGCIHFFLVMGGIANIQNGGKLHKNWIYKYEDEKKQVCVFADNGGHKTKSYNFSRNINRSWHDCGWTGQII